MKDKIIRLNRSSNCNYWSNIKIFDLNCNIHAFQQQKNLYNLLIVFLTFMWKYPITQCRTRFFTNQLSDSHVCNFIHDNQPRFGFNYHVTAKSAQWPAPFWSHSPRYITALFSKNKTMQRATRLLLVCVLLAAVPQTYGYIEKVSSDKSACKALNWTGKSRNAILEQCQNIYRIWYTWLYVCTYVVLLIMALEF